MRKHVWSGYLLTGFRSRIQSQSLGNPRLSRINTDSFQVLPGHREQRLKAKLRWQLSSKRSKYVSLLLKALPSGCNSSIFSVSQCWVKWQIANEALAALFYRVRFWQMHKSLEMRHWPPEKHLGWKELLHFPANEGSELSQTLQKTPTTLHLQHRHCCFLLGFISHFNLGGSCDRSVRVSCGGIISVQLAIRWAHHLHGQIRTHLTCKAMTGTGSSANSGTGSLFGYFSHANMHPNIEYPQYFPIYLLITVLDWTWLVWKS